MANVEMRCPHCGQTYTLTAEQAPQYAGQTITCTSCQRPFVVHVPGYSQPAPATAFPPSPPPLPGMAPIGYSGPQQPYVQQPQQSNGMAIASLVLGLLGFCIPGLGIVAIVLGAVGMNKTRDPRVGGKGLAIAGLVLGIVATMFIVVQIAIFLPALSRAREAGNRVKCASNLRQIGLAAIMYANDNKGSYPPDLQTLYKAADLGPSVFVCPATSQTQASGTPSFQLGKDLSYVYVGKGLTSQSPVNAIVAYESPSDHTPRQSQWSGGNVVFVDGHVEFVIGLDSVISELNKGHNPPRPIGQRQ